MDLITYYKKLKSRQYLSRISIDQKGTCSKLKLCLLGPWNIPLQVHTCNSFIETSAQKVQVYAKTAINL